MKPEKSRRKGRPPWKGHPNHHTPKQGSERDDLMKEQKKRAPHDCQRMTRKSGHRDIRQPKTQNETPQKRRREQAAAGGWRQGHILVRIGPPSRSRARGRRSRDRRRRPRPPTKPPRIRVKRSGRADIRIADRGTERWNRAPDESRSGGTGVGWGRTMWIRRNARSRKRRTPVNLIATRSPWNTKPAQDRDWGGRGSTRRK